MKKEIKLYNLIFPTFMLFAISPILWAVSIVGNFIIDSALLLILSLFIFKKLSKEFYKRTFLRVYLFGFLSDLIGTVYLIAVYLIYEATIEPVLFENGFIYSSYYSILVSIYYISGIIVAALCIFTLNYLFSFNYINLSNEKPRQLTKREKLFSALSFAIITAPYTYLIPSEVMYNLPF